MSSFALKAVAMLEQAYLDNSVDSPGLAAATMTWTGTSLGIAGVPLLVGAGEIDEIVETPAVTSIPGTKPWVMGVAAYMGLATDHQWRRTVPPPPLCGQGARFLHGDPPAGLLFRDNPE